MLPDTPHHEPEILLFAADGAALNARHEETMRHWLDEPHLTDSSITVVIAAGDCEVGL